MNMLESLSDNNVESSSSSSEQQSSWSRSSYAGNVNVPNRNTNMGYEPPVLRKCHSCGKVVTAGLKKCGRCKNAWYCNQECQKHHWPFHKENCRDPEKTEEMKEAEAHQNFQQTYEKPADDTLEKMLTKLGMQLQTMKMVAGTGSRKVKRSVKQDAPKEKSDSEKKAAWASLAYCKELLGHKDIPDAPSLTVRDWYKRQPYIKPEIRTYLPSMICSPLKLTDRGRENVDMNKHLPVDFTLEDSSDDPYLTLIPLLPVPVKTPLLLPFLTGKSWPAYVNSLDLISFYQKVWRHFSTMFGVPDQIVKSMHGKRKQICNAMLGIIGLLVYHAETRHFSEENGVVTFMKANWSATHHYLHVHEYFIFSTLGVEIDEDHHYVSADPEKGEPNADEVPGDLVKELKRRILNTYVEMEPMFKFPPDTKDYFEFEYKEDKVNWTWKWLLGKKACYTMMKIIGATHKFERVDENEGSMMNLDGEFGEAIEESAEREQKQKQQNMPGLPGLPGGVSPQQLLDGWPS